MDAAKSTKSQADKILSIIMLPQGEKKKKKKKSQLPHEQR